MKKINNIVLMLLGLMVMIVSCQDDTQELGRRLDKSEIKFRVEQPLNIDEGGNTVVLINETPGTVAMWDYGTGRSNRMVDTVRFPFKGEYTIKFSALTAGGVVEMDPVTVQVTEDNLNYVNDPLWTALTGGVDSSKTWILDNGKYGLASGPLAYADPSGNVAFQNFKPNWEPSGEQVGATAEDYQAEMTFSLKGGPFLTTVKPNEGGVEESGTFSLNTDNHTLSTTDATIVRVANFIPNVSNWNENLKILELNKNQLRVAVMRTNEEGPWYYILNFVSKEYAENYVPGFVPDPNFDHGNQLQILAGNSATTWKLSTVTPFNWTDLNGVYLNDWFYASDYPDWTGFNPEAVEDFNDVRLSFSRTGDVTLVQDDGTVEEGLYSINEQKNLITFEGIKPSIYISGGWVTATTTDYFEDEAGNKITGENQWKIVKTRAVSGVTTDIWFGKRDTANKEYMVYHFVLESGIPDIRKEMIRGLTGGITGKSSRTYMLDLNWPVDWVNPEGTGWTVPGTTDDWYWNDEIAASVAEQRITFSQVNGVVTATKVDAEGNVTSSPVEIDGENRLIIIPDMNIIQFGAGSELPTAGPEYKWVAGDFREVEQNGFWIGVKNNDHEYVAYHYILED